MGGVVFSVVLTVHVLAGLSVIGLVLMQHGKGADMGAAFGSGASGSLFGSSGSANFLSRTTGALAAVFFVTSLGLSYLASSGKAPAGKSVMDGVAPVSVPGADLPAAPVAPSEDGSKAKDIPR
jgi:preprotein translocase subunit SecG